MVWAIAWITGLETLHDSLALSLDLFNNHKLVNKIVTTRAPEVCGGTDLIFHLLYYVMRGRPRFWGRVCCLLHHWYKSNNISFETQDASKSMSHFKFCSRICTSPKEHIFWEGINWKMLFKQSLSWITSIFWRRITYIAISLSVIQNPFICNVSTLTKIWLIKNLTASKW